MTCVICKGGVPQAGKATLTLERGKTLVVFRHMPANICPNCGENYFEAMAVEQVYRAADETARAGVEMCVSFTTPRQRTKTAELLNLTGVRSVNYFLNP